MAEPQKEQAARPGFTVVECDEDLTIYGLAQFNGEVFASTDKGVYMIKNNKLVRLICAS